MAKLNNTKTKLQLLSVSAFNKTLVMYQEFGRDGIEGGMLMGLNYLQIMNKTGCLSSNLAFWIPSEERLIYIPF